MFTNVLNTQVIKELYRENKDLVLPVFSIVISIILFIFFVLPQLLAFPARKAEADQENEKFVKMQAAFSLLTSLNEESVDADLKIVQKTLPDKKDFESVLSAISTSAGNSSVQLIDYSYSAGTESLDKYPKLNFNIEIFGGISETIGFINELYKTYPLSDVLSITSADNTSKIQIAFYYRAFPPITIDDRTTVAKMNSEQSEALKNISEWRDSSAGLEGLINDASASSSGLGTPF